MAPTDPDFPFDMDELQCVLHVPRDYPGSERPTLRVTNPEMPRGFQINVEKGFDRLVDSALENNRQTTLLGLMNSLDRNLERFLIAEKAPTIKFVANLGSREDAKRTEKEKNATAQSDSTVSDPPAAAAAATAAAPSVQYSPEEESQAEKRRKDETRQLEARLGRLSLYQKSPDGLSYVIPITPSKPDRLPESLRAVKTVKLVVPALYPLEKSSIELQQVEGDAARATEAGFKKWVHESARVTLMSQVNYLVHNMHVLASTPISDDRSRETPSAVAETETAVKPVPQESQTATAEEIQEDRPHVKVIPRPPEWSAPDDTESESDFTSDEESEEEEEVSEDEEEGGAPVPEPSATTPARGVALSFPGLELFGIELLEVKMLCVTLKCERCKELTDVKNIKPTNDPSVVGTVRAESCRKCANAFGIGRTHFYFACPTPD